MLLTNFRLAGNALDLHSSTGVFTDVQGTVTARFAIPDGYTFEGDAMLKAPLSPMLMWTAFVSPNKLCRSPRISW